MVKIQQVRNISHLLDLFWGQNIYFFCLEPLPNHRQPVSFMLKFVNLYDSSETKNDQKSYKKRKILAEKKISFSISDLLSIFYFMKKKYLLVNFWSLFSKFIVNAMNLLNKLQKLTNKYFFFIK